MVGLYIPKHQFMMMKLRSNMRDKSHLEQPRRLPVKPQWSSEARQDLKEDTGKSSLATKDGLLFPCKTLLHSAVMDVVELAWQFILLAMEGNQVWNYCLQSAILEEILNMQNIFFCSDAKRGHSGIFDTNPLASFDRRVTVQHIYKEK